MAEDEHTTKEMWEILETRLSCEYARLELKRMKRQEKLMRKIAKRKVTYIH